MTGMILKASNGIVSGNTISLPKLNGIMLVPGQPSELVIVSSQQQLFGMNHDDERV